MQGSYRYYNDSYGNEYRYSTQKQSDGKYVVEIVKLRKIGLHRYADKVVKKRSFAKKKTAIQYCGKASRKASIHQDEVLERRRIAKDKRKAEKKANQPKGKERSSIEYTKKIKHTKELIKKIDEKTKALDSKKKALLSRRKTHEKKLKYYQKTFKKIRQQIYDEVEV